MSWARSRRNGNNDGPRMSDDHDVPTLTRDGKCWAGPVVPHLLETLPVKPLAYGLFALLTNLTTPDAAGQVSLTAHAGLGSRTELFSNPDATWQLGTAAVYGIDVHARIYGGTWLTASYVAIPGQRASIGEASDTVNSYVASVLVGWVFTRFPVDIGLAVGPCVVDHRFKTLDDLTSYEYSGTGLGVAVLGVGSLPLTELLHATVSATYLGAWYTPGAFGGGLGDTSASPSLTHRILLQAGIRFVIAGLGGE